MCLHGFTDTWRCWELVLPALERRHDVLAVTLAGHAGGPPIEGEVGDAVLADAVERAMDDELEGVGHCPQLDVPLETAQLILGFTR